MMVVSWIIQKAVRKNEGGLTLSQEPVWLDHGRGEDQNTPNVLNVLY
jgi:hypothetical protein